MSRTTRSAASILVTRRYREDVGDLSGLVASIERRGLIQPIAIRPDGELLDGLRRLQAWRRSARRDEPIPVFLVDEAIAQVIAQHDATVLRKDLTPTEKVALMRDLLPALQEEARGRKIGLGRSHGRDPDGRFGRKGETREVVAAMIGVSARTLTKMAAVVDAAREDPDRFGKLQEAMDRTGRADGPFKRLHVMRAAERIRAEPPPLPGRGPYRFSAIDPPWPFDPEAEDQAERGTHPYPLMTYAQIRALDVPSIMHADSALGLWVPNFAPHIRQAYEILDHYGFRPVVTLTWVKDKIGYGRYVRHQAEFCLLAVRGNPAFELTNQSSVFHAPRLAHSQKPERFYELIESLIPAPLYTAIFAHDFVRPGWDTHSTERLPGAPTPLEVAA